MALAYFITFSTYGTWLHGTAKGFGSVDREHNAYGAPFVAQDSQRERAERESLVQPPYSLDEGRRTIVCESIIEIAKEKNWFPWAVHVRTNHVHVVISAERTPERLMTDLKARASRNLTRAGFEDTERCRWTRHGSTPYLFNSEALEAAIHYVLYEQGEPMATYDGRNDPRARDILH